MSLTSIAKIDPASFDYTLPDGESYNQNLPWTDDVMYLVLYYNSPLDITTQNSTYQPARIYLWNLLSHVSLTDVSIVVNLDESGAGAQFWDDNLKHPDRPNGDTRTIQIGTVPPGPHISKRFDWQIHHIAGPGNVGFKETLGITPQYTVNYSGYPFNNAKVQVDPNVA